MAILQAYLSCLKNRPFKGFLGERQDKASYKIRHRLQAKPVITTFYAVRQMV